MFSLRKTFHITPCAVALFLAGCTTETIIEKTPAQETAAPAGDPIPDDDAEESTGAGRAVDASPPDEDTSTRKRVFVLSTRYAGATMGGPSGADAKCQAAAKTAKLGGTFRSGVVFDADTAETLTDIGPYYLVDRKTFVAPSLEELATSIEHPIDMTENGDVVADGTEVWTGALANCANWNTTNPYMMGTVGLATSLEKFGVAGSQSCESLASMYCFEQ